MPTVKVGHYEMKNGTPVWIPPATTPAKKSNVPLTPVQQKQENYKQELANEQNRQKLTQELIRRGQNPISFSKPAPSSPSASSGSSQPATQADLIRAVAGTSAFKKSLVAAPIFSSDRNEVIGYQTAENKSQVTPVTVTQMKQYIQSQNQTKAPFTSKAAEVQANYVARNIDAFNRQQADRNARIEEIAQSPEMAAYLVSRDLGTGITFEAGKAAIEAGLTGRDANILVNQRMQELKRAEAVRLLNTKDFTPVITEAMAGAGIASGLILSGSGVLGPTVAKAVEAGYTGMTGLSAMKLAASPTIPNLAETLTMAAPVLAIKGAGKAYGKLKGGPKELDITEIKGATLTDSLNVPSTNELLSLSKGKVKFITKKGEITGTIKSVASGTEKGGVTDTIVNIPEQKVGGVTKYKIGGTVVKKQTKPMGGQYENINDYTLTKSGSEVVDIRLTTPAKVDLLRIDNPRLYTEVANFKDVKGRIRVIGGTERAAGMSKVISQKEISQGTLTRTEGRTTGRIVNKGTTMIALDESRLSSIDMIMEAKQGKSIPVDWTDLSRKVDIPKSSIKSGTSGGMKALKTEVPDVFTPKESSLGSRKMKGSASITRTEPQLKTETQSTSMLETTQTSQRGFKGMADLPTSISIKTPETRFAFRPIALSSGIAVASMEDVTQKYGNSNRGALKLAMPSISELSNKNNRSFSPALNIDIKSGNALDIKPSQIFIQRQSQALDLDTPTITITKNGGGRPPQPIIPNIPEPTGTGGLFIMPIGLSLDLGTSRAKGYGLKFKNNPIPKNIFNMPDVRLSV